MIQPSEIADVLTNWAQRSLKTTGQPQGDCRGGLEKGACGGETGVAAEVPAEGEDQLMPPSLTNNIKANRAPGKKRKNKT